MRRSLAAALCVVLVGACGSREPSKARADQQPTAEKKSSDTLILPQAPPKGSAAAAAAASAAAAERGDSEDDSDNGGELPEARCPISPTKKRDYDALLDIAVQRLEKLDFAAAAGCADIASDLEPWSVEAHHLRAAGLAGMGRFSDAQVAYAMALALDPDDPETLAAAAHFYINTLPPKTRESTLVGLEHARRGTARALARYRKNKPLRARLALLEAQALNDLARADEALNRVNEALHLQPDLPEARYERGVALFNLCRFEEAAAAFKAVLRLSPNDPYAHYHLGLIYERDGREADAEAHLRRAWQNPSGEFTRPVAITAAEFHAEVDKAIDELPEDTRKLLDGVTVETVDLPARADLVAVDPPFAPTILGLFRGLPKGMADPTGTAPPRAILLYRRNLARAVRTREELNRQIRRTLLHEIGHVAGLDEDELRRRGLD